MEKTMMARNDMYRLKNNSKHSKSVGLTKCVGLTKSGRLIKNVELSNSIENSNISSFAHCEDVSTSANTSAKTTNTNANTNTSAKSINAEPTNAKSSKNTRLKKVKNANVISSSLALVFGVLILGMFAIFAIFPNFIAPYGREQMFAPFLPCSIIHILGTNNLGRDIFTEIVYATGSTLSIGLLSALISLGLGATIGLLAGYVKGIVGEVVNGFINFFLLIPMLPLAIVIGAYLGAGQQNIILTIALLGWCGTARTVRAKTMKLKNMPFVQSLKEVGIGNFRIVFKHILPNLKEVILAKYIMSVSTCIMLEATLSFLGLGDISKVTWGSMINLAYKNGGFAMEAYNWFLAPGFCIMLTVLAFFCLNHFFETLKERKPVLGKSFLD